VPPTVVRQPKHREMAPTPDAAAVVDPDLRSETIQLAHRLLRLASDEATHVEGDDAVVLDVHENGVRCLVIVEGDDVERRPLLSPREQEIVRMVSQGYPNKTIAAVLDISTWTVSTHLRRIFAKLGVRTRAAMVARAIELKMIAPPGPR
jgi:DNA-binding CsgD family transcriptional regulator